MRDHPVVNDIIGDFIYFTFLFPFLLPGIAIIGFALFGIGFGFIL